MVLFSFPRNVGKIENNGIAHIWQTGNGNMETQYQSQGHAAAKRVDPALSSLSTVAGGWQTVVDLIEKY